MCLGIPGKVVETYREHDVLMGKVDFGGVSKRVCLEHVPEVRSATTCWSTSASPSPRSTRPRRRRVVRVPATSMNQLDESRSEALA